MSAVPRTLAGCEEQLHECAGLCSEAVVPWFCAWLHGLVVFVVPCQRRAGFPSWGSLPAGEERICSACCTVLLSSLLWQFLVLSNPGLGTEVWSCNLSTVALMRERVSQVSFTPWSSLCKWSSTLEIRQQKYLTF